MIPIELKQCQALTISWESSWEWEAGVEESLEMRASRNYETWWWFILVEPKSSDIMAALGLERKMMMQINRE